MKKFKVMLDTHDVVIYAEYFVVDSFSVVFYRKDSGTGKYQRVALYHERNIIKIEGDNCGNNNS